MTVVVGCMAHTHHHQLPVTRIEVRMRYIDHVRVTSITHRSQALPRQIIKTFLYIILGFPIFLLFFRWGVSAEKKV